MLSERRIPNFQGVEILHGVQDDKKKQVLKRLLIFNHEIPASSRPHWQLQDAWTGQVQTKKRG
jgi:hypothetical protein